MCNRQASITIYQLNRPASPSIPHMHDAAITRIYARHAPVHDAACAVSSSVRADPQQGCRACRKTKVPTTHTGSGDIRKLAGEISPSEACGTKSIAAIGLPRLAKAHYDVFRSTYSAFVDGKKGNVGRSRLSLLQLSVR